MCKLVQHTKLLSQHFICHMARKDRSAIMFDRVQNVITLDLSYWLKTLTGEGGEETEVPVEKP